ncbi:quinone-interacting membrane-bound oxidoreductase complex subunit QmoC [Archaeoglobus veneficus]|uniref:Heterodisulfide reductase, subunit E, putative n=1 Tax=Archaeoglobus veneficus (strain DSM 11195 / SNP6) TaxID=693661 RepID=F2KPV1_ARCVS|nr:quinone-interacting membrane-bound oxidoreductase complex subunit QmoC [Archaeoglobus veneficus]AEA46458.1 heterodisulfide reductase, subunit E, putative [Archaeoglobus veneficus SNP6]
MEADPKFVKDVINAGGKSLKKCMQCATCSVVCKLSPDENPFPRKEMIWAQWGLKEKLLRDPNIWLCHQCNDCSAYCPRGARPGEVLSAIRAAVIANYSFPTFFARAFLNPAYFPLLVAIPILLLAIYFAAFAPHGFTIPEGEVMFSHFIPHEHVELVGMALGAWVGVAIIIGLYRYWTALSKERGRVIYVPTGDGEVKAPQDILTAFVSSIIEILLHSRFKECGESKYRFYAHLGIFYGFILIGIGTTIAFVYLLMGKELGLPLTDPAKIFGNIGAILLFGGATWVIYERIVRKDKIGFGGYFDWLFLGTLYVVAISGILTEVARYANVAAAYYLYLVHLVAVFVLLIYAPYSKFAHLAYRTIVMTYEKCYGK